MLYNYYLYDMSAEKKWGDTLEGKETILIADDADLNRAILRNLFEDEYNLLEAENGRCV